MTPGLPQAAIQLDGLEKRYGGHAALDGLDLSVGRGEIVCLLGLNGAGKTTALEITEGYRAPDTGTVRVLGLDPVADRAKLAPHMGLMLQRSELPMPSRPREALELFAAFYDDPLPPASLLEEVGLKSVADRPYRALSGGERQRLQLCLALIGRPDVAILDEPTAAMDVAARHRCWELLRALRGRGAAVLVATHLLDEAEAVADRVAVIHRGRLVAVGSPGDLRRDARGGGSPRAREVTVRLAAPLESAALERLGRVSGVLFVREDRPGQLVLGTADVPALVMELGTWLWALGVEPLAIEIGQVTLEEVFLRLVSEPVGG